MRRSSICIMAKLLSLAGKMVPVLALAVVNGSIGFLCGISITVLGSVGVMKLLGFFPLVSFSVLCAVIVALGILRGILRYFEQYSNHYIAFKLLATIRDKIFKKLRILCPAKLENKKKGEIVSMITADIETLEVFYAHTMSPVCIAVLVSFVMVATVWNVTSWVFGVYFIFAYLFVGVVMPIINSKILKNSGKEYGENFSKFNGFFLDVIKGTKEVILFGKESEKLAETDVHTQNLIKSSKKLSKKTTAIEGTTNAVVVIFNCSAVALAVHLMSINAIDAGGAVFAVVCLISSFGPVLALSALPNELTKTFASGNRVLDLMEEQPQVWQNQKGEDIQLFETDIQDLEFSYSKGSQILNGVNLKVNVGEIVAIKGGSGNGKSTILKLIMRFWDKDSGKINLQGVDVANVNVKSLKDNATLVSQTTYIFNGTIADNLRIAKKNATQEEMETACKKAGIHNHIISIENGYNSEVGGVSERLSTGEAQRIGIARAFLRDAKLILLDEPTGNVDSESEGLILQSIKQNMADKAVIIVSHRDSTISIATRVYNMKNGVLYE